MQEAHGSHSSPGPLTVTFNESESARTILGYFKISINIVAMNP